jgi:hypothetical protein
LERRQSAPALSVDLRPRSVPHDANGQVRPSIQNSTRPDLVSLPVSQLIRESSSLCGKPVRRRPVLSLTTKNLHVGTGPPSPETGRYSARVIPRRVPRFLRCHGAESRGAAIAARAHTTNQIRPPPSTNQAEETELLSGQDAKRLWSASNTGPRRSHACTTKAVRSIYKERTKPPLLLMSISLYPQPSSIGKPRNDGTSC